MIEKMFFVIALFIIMPTSTFAQNETVNLSSENTVTYKLKRNKGKISIDVGHVTIEGYDGKEIVFSTNTTSKNNDERAKGLRSINSLGLDDNTGLGINVMERNGNVEVKQIHKMDSPAFKILVPKGMNVSYNHRSQFGNTVTLKNIEKEIEVNTSYNNIVLQNVTGPVTINSIYGSIDAKFNQNVKGPLSLISIYGFVDVSIPKTAKADVKLSTSYGEILTAPELSLKAEVNSTSKISNFGNKVTGTLNGGGAHFDFRSDYNKVYLRKL